MSFKNLLAIALLTLPLAQVACSAESTDATADDAQDIKAKQPGDDGGMCGGIAGFACKAGFSCKLSGNHPDASGTCQKDSAEGEACGDDVAIQKTCASGLTCVIPAGAPISEHTAGKCTKVVSLDGEWGADGAVMTIDARGARIEFGCGAASIDALTPTSATTFTGTGSQTAGTGIAFPPGQGPTPEAATFTAKVSGQTMKLAMTVDGQTTKLTFTKDRRINLIRCL